jgi:hypothetical protein
MLNYVLCNRVGRPGHLSSLKLVSSGSPYENSGYVRMRTSGLRTGFCMVRPDLYNLFSELPQADL